jgi:lipoprotein LprG
MTNTGLSTLRAALGTLRVGFVTALLGACLLTTSACQSGPSTPSAASLLAQSQAAFNQLSSFHFALAAQNLGDTDPLPVTQATGDVQRPDELSTTATVNSPLGALQIKLIILGQQEWITDPLTGAFNPTTDYGGFLDIFDAQHGVGAALANLANPSTPQSSSAAAGDCWKISGTLPASAIASVVNGATGSNASVPASVCIGKSDHELYSVTFSGAVSQTDTAKTTRTFVLTKFNQPVTITPPASASPTA